ncbi:HelD family protein [Jatrophihabitans sp. DSM 45814]
MTDPSVSAELAHEQQTVSGFYERLDSLRAEVAAALQNARTSTTARTPAALTERDAFIAMHSERVERLNAVEDRLCFGRLDMADDSRRYVGRVGLADESGTRLLLDWRAPAAQAFYRATTADPHGAISRRHLITVGRRVTDLHDEILDLDAFSKAGLTRTTLDSDGALMLAMNATRTGRMQDIVATIQAEQDRIIRAPMPGILVVQGGPGTGKTAVALHRLAYLLYEHRERIASSGVLLVGPNHRFLRYIEQVLPSLGETGVLMATTGQLYPGVDAVAEEQPAVSVTKGRADMVKVLARAVAQRERVPDAAREINLDGTRISLTPEDVAAARYRARGTRKPHNVARVTFVKAMLESLARRLAEALQTELGPENRDEFINALRDSPAVRREVNLCWMPLTPELVLRDLYADPARLNAAAPQLSRQDRQRLQRDRSAPWTPEDVALLDELAELLGEDDEPGKVAAAQAAVERGYEVDYASGVLDLAGESEAVVTADALAERYLGGTGRRRSIADRAWEERAWVYAHVVVDEAQELSAMQWRMLMRRCPSRSMTVVGDVAQTGSPAGARSWGQMLDPYVGNRWRSEELTVNYRTPGLVMAMAERLLQHAGIEASVTESARTGDFPPSLERIDYHDVRAVRDAVAEEFERLTSGRIAVVVPQSLSAQVVPALSDFAKSDDFADPAAAAAVGLSVLTARQAKGLEFDVVIVVEPAEIVGESSQGINDLYVAITRPTQRLRVLYGSPLPAGMGEQ